jgi:long-subunit acyl-CoA synthetase (AMP-forming)
MSSFNVLADVRWSTPGELLHQLTDSTASLVFVDPALLLNLQKTLALPGAPKLPKSRIVLLCPPSARPAEFKDYKCVQEVWAEPIEIQHVRPGEEHNGAVLCYSSGTTGKAKGVETTHYNLTSQLQALNLVIEPLEEEKDVALGVLPFAHMYLFSTGIVSRRGSTAEQEQGLSRLPATDSHCWGADGSPPSLQSRYHAGSSTEVQDHLGTDRTSHFDLIAQYRH